MASRSTNDTYANVPERPNPASALNHVVEGVNDKPGAAGVKAEHDAVTPGALAGPTGPLSPTAGTSPVATPTAGAASDLGVGAGDPVDVLPRAE